MNEKSNRRPKKASSKTASQPKQRGTGTGSGSGTASGHKPKVESPELQAAGESGQTSARRHGGEAQTPSQSGSARTTGIVRVEREIGGRTLTLETGRMAKLADGAVVARYGDTMVLATAQSGTAREDIDFFPLTVEYREKAAAAGKFPGGFFKREGRPTTKEILGSRIIDRSIRPLFPEGYKAEVQVLSQVLCTDQENESDIVAAIASVAALAISSIPVSKTLGVVRIGLKDDKLLVNPDWATIQSPECKLNLTVSAHKNAIVMVEAGADQIVEGTMLEALELGHKIAAEVAELVEELAAKAGKAKQVFTPPARDEALDKAVSKKFGTLLEAAPITGATKQERSASKSAAKKQVQAAFPPPADATDKAKKAHESYVAMVCEELMDRGEREAILSGKRSDGRDHTTIRPITIEVGVLPRVHGSVLFTRGETQALVIATLGTVDDLQRMDGIYPESPKRFLLHYNFPPFSVGEVKRLGTPGRREIGHGALAERSVDIVLPPAAEFPYTLRITSEILESNGSSSMATVCGTTLALMDAGVPLKQPVAGVAMGLVKEGDRIAILSDILGSEDHCGDMDFKVAGTPRGITALQMDIKCDGLTREIMERALEQAREGRLHVLREMLKVMRRPRATISPNAPRLLSLKIPTDKIGLVIGPSGKNIRGMQDEYEVKINIEDDGTVTVAGMSSEKVEACVSKIKAMTAEVEVGTTYKGRVTSVKEFGAFIEILPGQEGLCHVSELSESFIRTVTEVVRIGDEVEVKVIGIDDFGKIKLSRKALLPGAQVGERPAHSRGEFPAREPREGREPREPREHREHREPREPREPRESRELRDFGPRGSRDPHAPRGDRPVHSERGRRPFPGDREDAREPAEAPERTPRRDDVGRPEMTRPEPIRGERRDAPRPDFPSRSEAPRRQDQPGRGEASERGPRGGHPAWGDEPRSFREREPRGEEGPRERSTERPPRHSAPAERGHGGRRERGDAPPPVAAGHRNPERESNAERADRPVDRAPERPIVPESFPFVGTEIIETTEPSASPEQGQARRRHTGGEERPRGRSRRGPRSPDVAPDEPSV